MNQPAPLAYSDAKIRSILQRVKTIALIGASSNWNRPSYFVMKYLQSKGYRVIPVNPGTAGQTLLGETIYAKLAEDKIGSPLDAGTLVGPLIDEAAYSATDDSVNSFLHGSEPDPNGYADRKCNGYPGHSSNPVKAVRIPQIAQFGVKPLAYDSHHGSQHKGWY